MNKRHESQTQRFVVYRRRLELHFNLTLALHLQKHHLVGIMHVFRCFMYSILLIDAIAIVIAVTSAHIRNGENEQES